MSTYQHYVPQFLLRPYGVGKKSSRRIFVLDKSTGNVQQERIKDLAGEHGFYDLRTTDLTLDPLINDLECQAAPLFRTVMERETVRLLNAKERRVLALFLAIQWLRTPAHLENFRRQTVVTRKILTKIGADEKLLSEIPEGDLCRDHFVHLIASVGPSLVEHLLNKTWMLMRAPKSTTFYTSDNPITLHNVNPAPPFRSNLGIAREGISLHLPLRPDLMLFIACASTVEAWTFRDLAVAKALAQGRPLLLRLQNVDFYNSLQVINAEQFVYSSTSDFALARDMIRTNPELRAGPRSLVIHPEGDSYPASELERWLKERAVTPERQGRRTNSK